MLDLVSLFLELLEGKTLQSDKQLPLSYGASLQKRALEHPLFSLIFFFLLITVKLLGDQGNRMHCFSVAFIRYVTFY